MWEVCCLGVGDGANKWMDNLRYWNSPCPAMEFGWVLVMLYARFWLDIIGMISRYIPHSRLLCHPLKSWKSCCNSAYLTSALQNEPYVLADRRCCYVSSVPRHSITMMPYGYQPNPHLANGSPSSSPLSALPFKPSFPSSALSSSSSTFSTSFLS